MTRLGGRATSRFPGEMVQISRWCCCLLVLCSPVHAGLYSPSDQIFVLSPQNVEPVLVNSTAAVLTEFYASWCGHCIVFSPVYRSLARDIREWKPAVALAAVDCAAEENRKLCAGYSIRAYPTVKFFHAYSKADSTGKAFKASSHDVATLRHRVIDKLENHQEPWPPACPPLEPTSQAEIDSFFETNNVQHLALIFEDSMSYVGREVTLDMLQFENMAVRRVLSSEETLVKKLEVTENMEARVFYSYALQRLPGVVRSGKPPPVNVAVLRNNTEEPWRPFNSSRMYMADLESAMHYSLRVELAAHTLIRGEELTSLRKYISVLTKEAAEWTGTKAERRRHLAEKTPGEPHSEAGNDTRS
ncbi:hypothetical protein JOQ06_006104 [Pogonophryne albipinna]|uniref:Thioredoxin domain-containing protein n=1 Tax=Pogonophryne albipinna TaxID=1090488 RepID=A0AAD6BEY8_9TELE|nr:hypothetical protein JOQ06_006104 [Pogonophryne albipinna]